MDKEKVTQQYMEIRGCKIKRTYIKRKDAKEAAKRMNRKGDGGGRLRAYSCQFCEHYHVGHIRIPKPELRAEEKAAKLIEQSV